MAFNPPPFIIDNEYDNNPTIDCRYYAPEEVHAVMESCRNKFSVLSLNIRSCRKNFISLVTFLNAFILRFSLIVLVETWLSKNSDESFHLDGYSQYNLYRDNYGGGIKIFYDNNFSIDVLHDFTFISAIFEILTFYLSGKDFKYLICCVYRPPGANPNRFNDMFLEQILDGLPHNTETILLGDFNVNLYNPLNLRYVCQFINNLLSHNCFPIITIPAKINENNPTTRYSLIDHIWSNFKKGTNHSAGVIEYLISDHLPTFYFFSKSGNSFKNVLKSRQLSNAGIQDFIKLVGDIDFSSIYSMSNPNEVFDFFYDKLFKAFNLSFPLKVKKINKNKINKPWITPLLKKCIKKKFYMYNLLKRGLISRNRFLIYKNLLLWVTKRIRNNYYNNEFQRNKGDVRKTWSDINVLLNRKKTTGVREIKGDNGNVLKGRDAANYFNNFFTNIATNLMREFSSNNDFTFLNRINPVFNSFFLYPTNIVEIFDVLYRLPNKGNNVYDMKPKLLLHVSDIILPVLVYIYNLCIECGIYPNALKTARVVPIFKSGCKLNAANYRPISNLISINKIFEILTLNRLKSFLEKNKVFSDIQFGFRPKSSTSLAIFTLLSGFVETFNKKMYTVALFIDLRKAFDLVDRDILIRKLNIYGIRGVASKFIKSYLENRQQYTSFNNHESNLQNTTHGVPQGSVMGPVLFNLFINDICNIPNAEKVLFADDTALYVSNSSLDKCILAMEEVIENLSLWLNENRLLVNTEKTKLMMISPKHINQLPNIYFNETILEWVSRIKYLGMYIDKNMNFILQTDEVCKKLSRLQGVFYALSPLVPRSVLIQIYYSLVYPVLIQNVIVWGGLNEFHSNRIGVAQNKILRIILKVKTDEYHIPQVSVNDMYRQLGFLKFKDVYRLFILKFVHFILYERFDVFIKYFRNFLPLNNHCTRNNRINLPLIRTNIEKKFTIYQTCLLMRQLPENFIVPQAPGILKKKFKELCLNTL